MEALSAATKATAQAQQLLAEIAREEAALSDRVIGGSDEPGLSPIRQGDTCFEYYLAATKKFVGIPVLGAPLAAQGFIRLLNEQHVSRPQLRN